MKGVIMKANDFKKSKETIVNNALNGLKDLISKYMGRKKQLTFDNGETIGFYNGEYLYYPKKMFYQGNNLVLETIVENEYLSTVEDARIIEINEMNLNEMLGFVNFLEENL